jgi:hypothetical protein
VLCCTVGGNSPSPAPIWWHLSFSVTALKQATYPPPQPLLAHMPCRRQHPVQPYHLPLLLILVPPMNKSIKPPLSFNGFTNNVVRVGGGASPPLLLPHWHPICLPIVDAPSPMQQWWRRCPSHFPQTTSSGSISLSGPVKQFGNLLWISASDSLWSFSLQSSTTSKSAVDFYHHR